MMPGIVMLDKAHHETVHSKSAENSWWLMKWEMAGLSFHRLTEAVFAMKQVDSKSISLLGFQWHRTRKR